MKATTCLCRFYFSFVADAIACRHGILETLGKYGIHVSVHME